MKKDSVTTSVPSLDPRYAARLAMALNAIEGQVVSSETRTVMEQAKREQVSSAEMRKRVAASIRNRYAHKV